MINEKAYYAYEEVWVVMTPGDTDISHIYLDKVEAERVRYEREEGFKKLPFSRNTKVVVVSLADAIDMIIQEVKDSADRDF